MPEFIVQPRPQTLRSTHWGEPKRCRSLSITDTCWELLTSLSDKYGKNRSETVERIIRQEAVRELDNLNSAN